MRRFALLAMLACVLAVPAAALALSGGGDGTLSVRNGWGRVTLRFNGSAIGRVAHGSIRVVDPIPRDGLGVDFWNCERQETKGIAVTCSGENIRFRAVGGRYLVTMRGSGISLSAVGRGIATLDGRGDDPDVTRDGVYSLNDAPYKSLPDDEKPIVLAAPAAG